MKSIKEREEERRFKQALSKADLRKRRLKYAGGYVQTPKRGVVAIPSFTKDWNSLYPNIEIRNRMCPSTWVKHDYHEGKLWFSRYGKTYEECWAKRNFTPRSPNRDEDHYWENTDKFVMYRVSELEPDPEFVGKRDLILVIEDWGGADSLKAAHWAAYSLWKKLSKVFRIPLSKCCVSRLSTLALSFCLVGRRNANHIFHSRRCMARIIDQRNALARLPPNLYHGKDKPQKTMTERHAALW